MKTRFIYKLSARIAIVVVLLLIVGLLIGGETRPVFAKSCGRILLDTWVTGKTTQLDPICRYSFIGTAGQYVSIAMERDKLSPKLDPYLELKDPYGTIVISDDDSGGNGNSLIDTYYLQTAGTYTIIARSSDNQTYGQYWIYVTLQNQ